MNPKPSDIPAATEVTSAAIAAIIPILQSYAMSRVHSKSHADDLVQDTIERAWRGRGGFIPGASLQNWMFQILRNALIDGYRGGRRLVQDVDGLEAARLVTEPDQIWRLRYSDTAAAVTTLSPEQRRAILLMMLGHTNVEAAAEMNCPLGTLKGHLRLGRRRLKAAGV